MTKRKETPERTGRPTLYKPEYAEQLIKYFNIPSTTVIKDDDGTVSLASNGKALQIAAEFPTKAGFACEIGVHRDTLHEWANATLDDNKTKKHPDFSDAYNMAELYQENILVQNGLTGRYNAAFTIFAAKNIIGYRDKQEVAVSGGFDSFIKELGAKND